MCIRCLSPRLIHLILRNPIREALYSLVQAFQVGKAGQAYTFKPAGPAC
jgi:hypothetical protein